MPLPVGVGKDDGESAPKKRMIARNCLDVKHELDDSRSTLSVINESIRFLGENMALVQSTLTDHGNQLGQVDHYFKHVVAPAINKGTSTQKDTTPDLCFVKNITDGRWSNLEEDLGSDHFLLAVHFPIVGRTTKSYTPGSIGTSSWDEICNSMDGQARNGKTFDLLKHLLDDTNTQVRRVLHELNGRSGPGPDGITNKLLRNADDPSVICLTNTINEMWKKGKLPDAWKPAHAIFISKPGKAPILDHLRPISHTSYVGKVAEHVVLSRIGGYLEDHECLPHHMIGF
ncbi:uncharacterized protein LOC142578500 [Dermacentor variabilis]|uniref:uncharacterized protein LOC142578500 n=1 Tax=Dermacentor variabilis TaxID=34621 RepID=UPI003F5B4EE2